MTRNQGAGIGDYGVREPGRRGEEEKVDLLMRQRGNIKPEEHYYVECIRPELRSGWLMPSGKPLDSLSSSILQRIRCAQQA